MPGSLTKTALAASLVLATCSVTVRAETGCGGITVPANIDCWGYQCQATGQCQPGTCDYDTFYWDNIDVRLRPGFVADTYFVGGTDRWCNTRWYEVHVAANGTYTISGAPIGELSPNGVGYSWSAYHTLPPGNDVSVVADGIHMAGTRDCHSSAVPLHGKLLVTIGPVPAADENQTRECDLNTACSGSGCPGEPMARYSIHLLLASLHIEDTPISYNSPRGPAPAFKVVYNQREANQPLTFPFSNLGPKWTFNWLSYVTDDGPAPPPQSVNPRVYVRGGGTEVYSGFNSSTQSYLANEQTLAVLVRCASNLAIPCFDGAIYERRFPDGSKEVFSESDGLIPRRIFLTRVADAAGNSSTITYDALRITTITDSLGQSTNLAYNLSGDSLKITRVTDPFGRSATFDYTAGKLHKDHRPHWNCIAV